MSADEWLCLPCGAVNWPDADFCAECGSPRPGPTRWAPRVRPYVAPAYSQARYGDPPHAEPPHDDQPRAGRTGNRWPDHRPVDEREIDYRTFDRAELDRRALDYRPIDERWPDDPWADEPDTTPFGPDPVLAGGDTHPPPAARLPPAPPRPVRRALSAADEPIRLPVAGRVAVAAVIIGVLAASSVAVADMAGWLPTTHHTATGETPTATGVGPTVTQPPPSPLSSPPRPSPSGPSPSAPTPSASPSRSASATPTPTPSVTRTTPAPTPPPTVIGSVDVRAVNTNPHVRAVGGLFDTYFNGINLKLYGQTLALYDPAGVLDPTDPQQAANFTQGVSTSVDTDVVVRSIVDASATDLAVRITFQSHQSAGFGPPGAPNQTCTLWDSTYVLRPNRSGVYLIFDQPIFSHQGC